MSTRFKNWHDCSLNDVLVDCKGGAWGDASDHPNVGVIRTTNISDKHQLNLSGVAWRHLPEKQLEKQLLSSGDIIMTKSNSIERVGACAFFVQPEHDIRAYIAANFCQVLKFDTALVYPEYGFFWMISPDIQRYLKDQATGTSSSLQNINSQKIKSTPFAYPNIEEQRRIVARIKECMERVEEIEGNGLIVAEELKALFHAMLYEKFTALFKEVPVDYLENVAKITGGGSLPKGIAQDTGNNCVLLVKVGDMNEPGNERIIKVSRGYISAEQAGRKVVQPGSVIFPKRGGAIATNKKRMLGRPALIDPNLMAVVAHPEKLRPEYLYYWTQTIDLAQISNGGVIPQLNRKDLAPLEIPVPDLDHQDTILSELEQADASCFELKVTFDASSLERSALRESILRKAFAGEL